MKPAIKEPLRPVYLILSNQPYGYSYALPYPAYADDYNAGRLCPVYRVNTFLIMVSGTSAAGEPKQQIFESMRFGVKQKSKWSLRHIDGMSRSQEHIITQWQPDYHGASDKASEQGAWILDNNFYIRSGPDYPKDNHDMPTGSTDALEICGVNGFSTFNKYIIELSGTKETTYHDKLNDIAAAQNVKIRFMAMKKPKLGRPVNINVRSAQSESA